MADSRTAAHRGTEGTGSARPPRSARSSAQEFGSYVVVAVLFAILGVIGGFVWGKSHAEAQSESAVRTAALSYADHLKHVIDEAARAADTRSGLADRPQDVLVYGRSIVSIRDELLGTLQMLSGQLDSELEQLSSLVGEYEKAPTKELAGQIGMTIRLLHEKWPTRQAKIDNAIRRLLADLQIERVYFRDRR